MANIIHVGTNEAVLATRKTILERAGHDVILARDLREVMLRGATPTAASLAALGVIGVACYAGASLELNRRMATQ